MPFPFYEWFLIGFCGKIYPCIVKKTTKIGFADIKSYHYNIKKMIEDENSKYKNQYIAKINEIENLNFSDLFIKYKVPTFVVNLKKNVVTLNPILKEFKFFKVKDTFTAFQEIQQYISGVLGTESNEPIVTDDKYKIIAAGFDIKTSFRKDKNN